MLAVLRSRTGLLKCLVASQGNTVRALTAVPSWKVQPLSKQERMDTWDYVNSVYFGPERDMKNFPNPTQPERHEPVRLGLFPAKWFEMFYSKTGVTGPYMFLGGLSMYMMSKEIMVVDHYFWEFPSFWIMIYIFHKHSKVGPKLAKFMDDKMENMKHIQWDRPMGNLRAVEAKNVEYLERLVEECETATYVHQAKTEGVGLQLEAAYRQRLHTAYQEVKKRLDYEMEKENLKRRFEQEHMVNWIVSSVTKSITPQQESDSIKSCIATLNRLATKHQTATA